MDVSVEKYKWENVLMLRNNFTKNELTFFIPPDVLERHEKALQDFSNSQFEIYKYMNGLAYKELRIPTIR